MKIGCGFRIEVHGQCREITEIHWEIMGVAPQTVKITPHSLEIAHRNMKVAPGLPKVTP